MNTIITTSIERLSSVNNAVVFCLSEPLGSKRANIMVNNVPSKSSPAASLELIEQNIN